MPSRAQLEDRGLPAAALELAVHVNGRIFRPHREAHAPQVGGGSAVVPRGGALFVVPLVLGIAVAVGPVVVAAVAVVAPRVAVIHVPREVLGRLARSLLHVVMDLQGRPGAHVDLHPVRLITLELEGDLVAPRRDVEPLEEAVEVVHDPGVVAVHVDAGLVGIDEEPQVAAITVGVVVEPPTVG
ncbi:MAG TPA: hypothetical protein VF964_00840, partial [Vicinamibacteria bacterium]